MKKIEHYVIFLAETTTPVTTQTTILTRQQFLTKCQPASRTSEFDFVFYLNLMPFLNDINRSA